MPSPNEIQKEEEKEPGQVEEQQPDRRRTESARPFRDDFHQKRYDGP